MKPIIGITLDYLSPNKVESGIVNTQVEYSNFPYYALRRHYSEAILKSGGLPIFLPFESYKDDIDQIFDAIDGLMIPGGDLDVDPSMYGEELLFDTQPYIDRCEFEQILIQKALSIDMPLLCICHGMQLLNVIRGGSLYQNIMCQISGSIDHKQKISMEHTSHEVDVKEGSLLYEITKKTRFNVNSNHRQSVKGLGKDLIASAICQSDNVIEAIESTNHKFVLGIEWHPEIGSSAEEDRAIFDAFIQKALYIRRGSSSQLYSK